MEAYKKGVAFNEHVLRFQDIKDYFTQEELNKILDPANYLGLNERCINSVLDKNSD
jgi:adenylosuccinate lyase